MAQTGNRVGRGPSSPLRREKGDYAMDEGADLVAGNSKQVVGVSGMAADGIGGEYPWRMNFGSPTNRLRHLNIRSNNQPSLDKDVGRVMIADAIERWESRASVFVDQIGLKRPKPDSRELEIKVVIEPIVDSVGPQVTDDRRTITLEVEA